MYVRTFHKGAHLTMPVFRMATGSNGGGGVRRCILDSRIGVCNLMKTDDGENFAVSCIGYPHLEYDVGGSKKYKMQLRVRSSTILNFTIVKSSPAVRRLPCPFAR